MHNDNFENKKLSDSFTFLQYLNIGNAICWTLGPLKYKQKLK